MTVNYRIKHWSRCQEWTWLSQLLKRTVSRAALKVSSSHRVWEWGLQHKRTREAVSSNPGYCNFRLTVVKFQESAMPFQVHPKNKWSCCSESDAQCLRSIKPCHPSSRCVWGCWSWGGGIHNDVTHRKYRGRLGTSQGWFLLHGLTSSSVKINRQSEYGTRVHNGIVDFHAQSKLIFQLSPMFICAIQLSINRVSFLGSINKCQVGKHFRSKQSLEMFLFILKHVRIFYNSRLQNVHVLCLGQSNNLLEKKFRSNSSDFWNLFAKDSERFSYLLEAAHPGSGFCFCFFHDWIGLQPEAFQIKSWIWLANHRYRPNIGLTMVVYKSFAFGIIKWVLCSAKNQS